MLNSLYTYIRYMICKDILFITFLNDPKLILFHTAKGFQILLCITNYSIKSSFIYTQLNDQIVLFLIIHFSISLFFVLSLNVKQLYLTHRYDSLSCYHSGPEWTRKQLQWRGTPHTAKLQHHWSLAIRLFSVITRTLVMGSYSSAEMQSV